MIDVIVPIRIESVANKREHFMRRAARAKKHRRDTHIALRAATLDRPSLPLIVTLTRVAARVLDDDNLRSAFKAARDGVADWLGVDDGSELVEWRYAQETGKQYVARVRVEARS